MPIDSLASEIGVVSLLPARAYEARYTPSTTIVGFAFDGQTGEHAFASDRAGAYRTRPNSVAVTPAGCDVYSRSAQSGEYLVLRLAPGRVSAARRFSDRFAPAALGPAKALRRALLSARTVEPMETAGAMAALRDAVLALQVDKAERSSAGGWMTPRRLARIDDYIESRLGEPLSVERMAAELGLSAGFFSRALKAAIGASPYDYVLDRRVARARRMIENGAERLVDVAAECGFASQAHMTAQMRRRIGATPGALRRRYRQ